MSAMVIIQLSIMKTAGKVITNLKTLQHTNMANSSTYMNILGQGMLDDQ